MAATRLYVLIDRQTFQTRSIQGAVAWDSPESARKALRRECRKLKVDYGDEIANLYVVDTMAYPLQTTRGEKISGNMIDTELMYHTAMMVRNLEYVLAKHPEQSKDAYRNLQGKIIELVRTNRSTLW